MRIFKFAAYLLVIVFIQTVFLARLNLWGAIPDLVLTSIIIYAVLNEIESTAVFAFAAAFMQEALSIGPYIGMLTKLLSAVFINIFKDSFMDDKYLASFYFVAAFTPLTLIAEAIVLFYFYGRPIFLLPLLGTVISSTVLNTLTVFILYPVINKLNNG